MNAIIEHPHFADTTATSGEGRYTVLTPNRQSAFLANLQLFGNVRNACQAARVSAQTVYRARRASPGFRLAWDAALLAARGHAEATLADRALNGVEEAVYYHGEEVARRRRYDSRLLLAHLARLDRLEERAEVSAMLGLLDDCIEALGEGADIDELLRAEGAGVGAGVGAQNNPQDPVPPVPSCRTCEGEEELEEELAEEPEPELERRLSAMEAARPADAPPLSDLTTGEADIGAVEAAQLAAFEAGLADWWMTRPESADDAFATHPSGVS